MDRLEFVVTYLCNSKCKHCQLREERREFPTHIDKDPAVEIVKKVGERYQPKSIMTFGGEPMLFPNLVYPIHHEAARAGIPARELITNGFWSDRRALTQRMADDLLESGVNDVCFSVDCFHQEFIPIERVREAALALLKVGVERIEWSPCWMISTDRANEYNTKTRAILNELCDLPVKRGEGNVVQPEGRATRNLREFFQKRTSMLEGGCGEMPYTERLDSVKSISVEPDGRIAVCNQFYIGNASQTDVIELLESYNPYKIPEAKAIIEGGMEGLLNYARSKGVLPDPHGYYSICDMCISIREEVSRETK